MTRPSIRRVRPRDDGGAILVLAILVVTVVALVTGFVLTRGGGSLRATVALRDVARASYAADGAAQVAINGLRTGYNTGNGEPNPWYYTNAAGTGCFGYDGSGPSTMPIDTLVLDTLIPKRVGETQTAMSAAVVCTPEDATGEQGSAVPITNANKPGNAVLTLGTSGAEHGFSFKANGDGAAFRVRGGVWSNSNIVRAENGELRSTESIRAHTGCTPTAAMVAPVVDCSAGTAPDPGYQSDLEVDGTGVPPLRVPPASCPNNGTVTLEPGYYDDVTKLNALTDTNTTCFIHLKPGPYYLDFHNAAGDPLRDTDIAASAENVWKIGGRKTVVAGTLDPTATTMPGRCVSPIDDVGAQGVQLIFGGTSRMSIDANGQATGVEICGSYRSNRPPIAIYGQRTGTASPTVVNGPSALVAAGTPTVTEAPGAGTFTGATADNLRAEDGNQSTNANLAVWARGSDGQNSETRSITMNGFSPATALPPGTVLTGATLRVTHRSTGSQNKITFTPSAGPALATATLPPRSTLGTDPVDLTALNNWGAFQKSVHDAGLTGAGVRFESTLGRSQVAQLDAVRLELTYYVPQLRAQLGTVVTPGGEPVVKVDGNSTTYYVQGTTYVPQAKIDLSLNNIAQSVFRFGVIARSLRVFETGSFDYPGDVIELPDNSPGFGFETTLVRLEVYVCPGVTSGCSKDSGDLSLTARVKIFDNAGTPGPPNRQVTVLGWSHPR